MRNLNRTITMLGLGLLLAPTGIIAQELAAFKIPDSARAFVFNCRSLPAGNSTNASATSVEGTETILARRFKTKQEAGTVTVVFYDVIVCRAARDKGNQSGSSVMGADELSITYPLASRVLVRGRLLRLADLSEDWFVAPLNAKPNETYTGDEALKKLKELGLDPPDDMEGIPQKSKSQK